MKMNYAQLRELCQGMDIDEAGRKLEQDLNFMQHWKEGKLDLAIDREGPDGDYIVNWISDDLIYLLYSGCDCGREYEIRSL